MRAEQASGVQEKSSCGKAENTGLVASCQSVQELGCRQVDAMMPRDVVCVWGQGGTCRDIHLLQAVLARKLIPILLTVVIHS